MIIYYKDGDKLKGPIDEQEALTRYNGAEFSSDVTFQIRDTEADADAPFHSLKHLITQNGAKNPFRDELLKIETLIEQRQEEVDRLKDLVNKRAAAEERLAIVEKKLAEMETAMKKRSNDENKAPPAAKPTSQPAPSNKIQEGIKVLEEKFPGIKVQQFSMANAEHARVYNQMLHGDDGPTTAPAPKTKKPAKSEAGPSSTLDAKVESFSMGNEKHARMYRESLHSHFEKDPLLMCTSCSLMMASLKQLLLHCTYSCPDAAVVFRNTFDADFPRWKKEDEMRRAMGRRLYVAMSADERGAARPQTDFIEDIHAKLTKDMNLYTDAGRFRAMEFLKSAPATKLRERLEKHFREAKGKLVCSRCQVACKSHVHFVIHLCTYDHRLRVKGTSYELISLLIGWFNRGCYLKEPDTSEYEDDEEPDPNWTLEMNTVVWHSGEVRSKPAAAAAAATPDPAAAARSQQLHRDAMYKQFAEMTIIPCIMCDGLYTNYRQYVVHTASDQHYDNVKKEVQSPEEKEEDRKGHAGFLKMCKEDLQKWRADDKDRLAAGCKLFAALNEQQKKEARPAADVIKKMHAQLAATINRKPGHAYWDAVFQASAFLDSATARAMMAGFEKHLVGAKHLICTPCKAAFSEPDQYFIHTMTYEHVKVTNRSIYELVTALIGIQKKHLVV